MNPKETKEIPTNMTNKVIELKGDGNRQFAFKKNGNVQLIYRKDGKSVNQTAKYPEVVKAIEKISGDFILDGEVCCFYKKGVDGKPVKSNKTEFNGIQQRSGLKDEQKIKERQHTFPCEYMAFDIIYKDGENLKALNLRERKEILKSLTLPDGVFLPEESNDVEFIEKMRGQDQEGVVIKDLNSTYTSDKRTSDWVKYKFRICKDVTFTGYEDSDDGATTVYNDVDRVRVGKRSDAEQVRKLIDTNGQVTLEINYQEETEDGRLRQPTFKSKIVK